MFRRCCACVTFGCMYYRCFVSQHVYLAGAWRSWSSRYHFMSMRQIAGKLPYEVVLELWNLQFIGPILAADRQCQACTTTHGDTKK